VRKLQFKRGERFGRLEIIKENGRASYGAVLWLCKCECGNFLKAGSASLKSGNTRSCGCLQKDKARAYSTTHGLRKNPLYDRWHGMRERCYNEKHLAYKYYGGRGITVCERWRNSVKNFVEDMGPLFDTNLSLDRINNDGNYSPENCRWATQSEQLINRRGFGSSKHCGVAYYKPTKKWQAKLSIEGKPTHLGYFNSEQEAAQVVKAKRLEVYGI